MARDCDKVRSRRSGIASQRCGRNGRRWQRRRQVSELLERVGQIMKPILKDVELWTSWPANSDSTRWRSTVQWVRDSVVRTTCGRSPTKGEQC